MEDFFDAIEVLPTARRGIDIGFEPFLSGRELVLAGKEGKVFDVIVC